jgi:Fe-S oxidoreductase/nitrate reductase gamma subunit
MERRRASIAMVFAVLVVLLPLGVMLAWWLGTLPGPAHPEVGRPVFGDVPSAMVALFYVTAAAVLGVAAYLFYLRARNWDRGARERRLGHWGLRLKEMLRGVSMASAFEDRPAGVMHGMIFFGFVTLFLGTVTLELDHLLPVSLKFLEGRVYQGYKATLDGAGIMLVSGVIWAALRRFGFPPPRIKAKTRPEDIWILLLLGLVGVTGLLVEAARISVDGRPGYEVWAFVGYALSPLFRQSQTAHHLAWITHVAVVMALFITVPTTKLRHMLTSPVNMALSPRDRPRGAMREMPNLLEATDIETLGASRVSDFTWKQLFDTDSCTICGRCTSVCPANLTGKALDPREIVLKVGEVMAASGSPQVSPPVGMDKAVRITSDSVLERITSDELWACTTCRACDAICPVDIEILDKILDMRRHLALMEADFPTELGSTFINMENSANPYGMSQQDRAAWTRDLDFPVKVLGEPGVSAEYLFWVGCAGSFDDRNRKATVALARLLRRAGIDFAILGPKESCTGDPARRAGNEYLFQQLALRNIETLNGLGVTQIITQCPHCFNTLANEYPQFGGRYQVRHHSQVLADLLAEGRLVIEGNPRPGVVFHDPCYLGRHNGEFSAPRRILAALDGGLLEMPRNRERSFCCGAGGARVWMEEKVGKKVNLERTEEALATGASVIATGCPFCQVMLEDGVKDLGRDDEVAVRELTVLLCERILGA